jgi:hypothetical protein
MVPRKTIGDCPYASQGGGVAGHEQPIALCNVMQICSVTSAAKRRALRRTVVPSLKYSVTSSLDDNALRLFQERNPLAGGVLNPEVRRLNEVRSRPIRTLEGPDIPKTGGPRKVLVLPPIEREWLNHRDKRVASSSA